MRSCSSSPGLDIALQPEQEEGIVNERRAGKTFSNVGQLVGDSCAGRFATAEVPCCNKSTDDLLGARRIGSALVSRYFG